MNVTVEEHLAQHGGDRAVGLLKRPRHPLDERRRRIVGDEVGRELRADEARRGRLPAEQRDGVLDLGEAVAGDRVAEHRLGAEVVARRVELEETAPDVERLLVGRQRGVLSVRFSPRR